jgi:hypothetical protein
MALDLSSVTSVVSDVAPYAVSAIVAVVAASAAVEACKWAYSEVMSMLGRNGYGDYVPEPDDPDLVNDEDYQRWLKQR